MSEEEIGIVLDEAKESMEKSIRSYRIDLQKVRTGRANPAILDGIQVDYYGTPTPLNQLANLSAPDPRLIVISPYDKGALAGIERAILMADLGLTPSNDGKLVRIPIPALTEERRKELVKQIKKSAEGHKIGVREARRAAVAMLKDLEADGSVPADDRRRTEKTIQDLTDANVKKIDEMTAQKEEEILQV
ncbi:MAG: ribosome recycling factor [Planctomycetota bacterium]|jgi:ribosome recycling factor